jgi:hypothetical protein
LKDKAVLWILRVIIALYMIWLVNFFVINSIMNSWLHSNNFIYTTIVVATNT